MTQEAMISPEETREYQTGWNESNNPPTPIYTTGWRVAQVVPQGQQFPMAEPIFWVECSDEVQQDTWWYLPGTEQIVPVPPVPFPEPNVTQEVQQPISEGVDSV